MLFGSHVSSAGGVENAPERAVKVGCEVFQFFSRPPQGGKAPVLTSAQVKNFKQNCQTFKQAECYIHAPYLINLASVKSATRYYSGQVLREELERGSVLGVKYMMTHIGSSGEQAPAQALAYVVKHVIKVLEGYTGQTQFLLEISAGAGNVIGDQFEEIQQIITGVEKASSKLKNKIGVCFDTCHAFTAGYDLRTAVAVNKTLDEFDKIVGLKRLKLIHCNDSKVNLGEHRDRHEHLGQGKIGLEGFRCLVHHTRLKNINFILETPKDTPTDDPRNLNILKELRG